MRFTVAWSKPVLAELARIWTSVSNQQAVADAADHIDRVLKSFPERAGDPVGKYRRLVAAPIEVIYSVSPDDCMVTILKIFYLG